MAAMNDSKGNKKNNILSTISLDLIKGSQKNQA